MALGFAGPAVAERLTIAALGDSLTAGYGLDMADGFVPQLQGWLDAQGAEVTVLNAGVSGDTTAGGLARVDWTLTDDVDAMIVALGGNDFLRGIDPATTEANLRAILDAAAARDVAVLLVGIAASANFGPEFQSEFNAIFPELGAEYGVAVVPDFFAALKTGEDLDAAVLRFMQADGIHPNAEGVARIVEALGPEVLRLIAAAG